MTLVLPHQDQPGYYMYIAMLFVFVNLYGLNKIHFLKFWLHFFVTFDHIDVFAELSQTAVLILDTKRLSCQNKFVFFAL